MPNETEMKILGAGYCRLTLEQRHEILGMAEAFNFVQKTGTGKREAEEAEGKNRTDEN